MDVDLSTDLSALGDLLTPLLEGKTDLAIGSRRVSRMTAARRCSQGPAHSRNVDQAS